MADIVVGYDGSDGAKAALEEAASLAKDLHARVVPAYTYHLTRLGGEVQDLAAALKETGEQILAEASEAASARGVEVETALVPERPAAEGLSELADERQARMIVVGTHGESAIKGVILGSTSHKLLQIANVPVLVVRTEPS